MNARALGLRLPRPGQVLQSLRVRIALLLAIVVAAASCGGPDGPSGPPLKLTIAEASQPGFALLYVADAKGLLKDAGLDVTFTSFALGRDALASVIDGKADLATVLETPATARIYEGRDLAIISMLNTSTRSQALLARRDRGIASLADLGGKRVGVHRGTSVAYLLAVLLAIEGIPVASVTEVNLEVAETEAALRAGKVDAVVSFNPHLLRLRNAMGERAALFYSDAYTEASMLAGMREVVVGKPEAMTRLVRALVKAQGYVERNRDESIRIVTARLAGRTDEKSVAEIWGHLKLEAKLDNVLVSTMALEAQWMKDSGRFAGPVPDFRRAVFADYLRAVRPEAVTVRGGGAK